MDNGYRFSVLTPATSNKMSIIISKTHKIRLLFIAGFTILIIILISDNYAPLQVQTPSEPLSTSLRNSNYRTSLRKSTTSFAPLFEISEAINSLHPHPTDLSFSEPFWVKSFPCDDLAPSQSTPRFAQRGNFWALYNFIKPRKQFHCDESITYTTHSEYSYLMDNLGPLLQRWEGPLSLAVYIPGSDFSESLKRLIYLRECGPDSDLAQDFLSVHFFFDHEHVPEPLPPEFEMMFFSESGIDCTHPIFENLTLKTKSFRTQKHISYPINVGRNIAKESATTKYVLPSDIELYPSPGLIPDFLEMIKKDPTAYEGRKVFVLPIFEADGQLSTDELPQNKVELVDMLKNKLAVPFHYRICPKCHSIPKAAEWMKSPVEEGLHVFHVTNRTGPQAGWEPIYIGTREEPGYDERLSWEGLKDKMSQGFLLCTLEYEMHILDNAFLVHSPGIKSKGPTFETGRKKFISKQSQVIQKEIKPELRLLYGDRDECKIVL